MTTTIEHSDLKQARKEMGHVGKATLLRWILGMGLGVAVYLAVWWVAGAPDIWVTRNGMLDPLATLNKLRIFLGRYPLLYPILLFAVTPLVNVLPYYIGARRLSVDVKGFFARPQKAGESVAVYGIVGVGFSLAVSLGLGVFVTLYRNKISFGGTDFTPWFGTPLGAVLMLVTIVIVGPVTEEFIFRGVLLSAFKRYGNLFAVICSSLIWALLHGNLLQALPVFCMGLVLGTMAIRLQSIRPSILIHILYNAVVIAVNLAREYLGQPYSQLVLILFTLLDISLIIGAIVLFCVCFRQFEVDGRGCAEIADGRMGPKAFLTAWPILLVVVIYTVQIITSIHIY